MSYVLTRANGLLILIHNTCSSSVFFVLTKRSLCSYVIKKLISHYLVILHEVFGFGAFNNNNLSKKPFGIFHKFLKQFPTTFLLLTFYYWHCRPNRSTFGNQIPPYQQFLFPSSFVTFYSANTQVL